MKKGALRAKAYKEATPSTAALKKIERQYPTSILPALSETPPQIDNVDAAREGSIRFVQDHLESEINKQLEEAFGEFYFDGEGPAGADSSSEATAQRIFAASTDRFEIWRDQNPDMSEDELIDGFGETLRCAVDEGYARAVDIFASMEIDDAILETAVETVSILHKLFSEYLVDLYAQLDESEE
ncbi:MAG: DUF5610 domain-containing protein [Deltaproteobacteria bacterium]|nr:DUF5610 domain-containing protein [Deltaproteobacteria bacterium]